jgi:hypothetical protein
MAADRYPVPLSVLKKYQTLRRWTVKMQVEILNM